MGIRPDAVHMYEATLSGKLGVTPNSTTLPHAACVEHCVADAGDLPLNRIKSRVTALSASHNARNRIGRRRNEHSWLARGVGGGHTGRVPVLGGKGWRWLRFSCDSCGGVKFALNAHQCGNPSDDGREKWCRDSGSSDPISVTAGNSPPYEGGMMAR